MWEVDWELKNLCFQNVVLEKTPESQRKPILNIHWKGWCGSWSSNILVTWCEELTHWKRPGCWGRLKAEGEGDDRGWDGWRASPTQCTWAWANSGRRRGKPGCWVLGHKESDMTALKNNTYIWNVEKWYWWTYLWSRNRDTDAGIETQMQRMDGAGEGEDGTYWDGTTDI